MFNEDHRRPHEDQVIFTIFDPCNTDTPKILKPTLYMFGIRCHTACFDLCPMLHQCSRCHKLRHSNERCLRPATFVRGRICSSPHSARDHLSLCWTRLSHTTQDRCNCPLKCFNCKDAGKPETGHHAYDHMCPLRAMYHLPFS